MKRGRSLPGRLPSQRDDDEEGRDWRALEGEEDEHNTLVSGVKYRDECYEET